MQGIFETGNATVDKMSRLNITGNIIPPAWFRTIRKATGKPNLNAIVILSDIVYWYRPVEVRDERSGQIIGLKKRFYSDFLQRSYQQIAEQFGITKRDATNAIVELEKIGVVRRVFRTIQSGGQQVPNVLFLDLCVERLEELTYPEEQPEMEVVPSGLLPEPAGVSLKMGRGVTQNGDTPPRFQLEGIPQMSETNTENTNREYNRDYPLLSYQAELEVFREQIDYETLKVDYAGDGRLDELVGVAMDALTSTAETIRVNREEKPAAVVKAQLHKLTMFHIQYVLKCMGESGKKARNIRALMLTALYNAVNTHDHYYRNLCNSDMASGRLAIGAGNREEECDN